jgi:hypothetical protein
MKLAEWREDCMEVGEHYAIETQKEDPVTKKFIEVTGTGYENKGDFFLDKNKLIPTSNKTLKLLIETSVNCNDAIINCQSADITASTKAIVDSPIIELGRGATESVIKGNAFKTMFDKHVHGAAGTPPLIPMLPNTLSKVTKSK